MEGEAEAQRLRDEEEKKARELERERMYNERMKREEQDTQKAAPPKQQDPPPKYTAQEIDSGMASIDDALAEAERIAAEMASFFEEAEEEIEADSKRKREQEKADQEKAFEEEKRRIEQVLIMICEVFLNVVINIC